VKKLICRIFGHKEKKQFGVTATFCDRCDTWSDDR
jgi:hypothetical protein